MASHEIRQKQQHFRFIQKGHVICSLFAYENYLFIEYEHEHVHHQYVLFMRIQNSLFKSLHKVDFGSWLKFCHFE